MSEFLSLLYQQKSSKGIKKMFLHGDMYYFLDLVLVFGKSFPDFS